MRTQEQQNPTEDRSLGDLLSELMSETTTLIRQEITLAKAEMTQKAIEAGQNVGAIAAGGIILYLGVATVIAAIILLLVQWHLAPWIAALIVGAVVVASGVVAMNNGMNALKNMDPAPKQTVKTLKDDVQWAKDQTR